jgi:YbbR domain-containing protein
LKIKSLLGIIIDNWPAKVLAFTAAVLLFVFNRMNNLKERNVEVLLDVILPKGYAIAAPYQEKVSVTIKGDDEESIAEVKSDDFWVFVDLSEYAREDEIKLPIRYTRRGPALRSTVFVDRIEPTEVLISLERELTKTIPVRPVFKGVPQDGYTLNRYTVNPSTVEVKGPQSRIEALKGILTEEIDITGRRTDFTLKVKVVQQDPFITISSQRVVEFQGVIREIIMRREYVGVPITAVNLSESLSWDSEVLVSSITLEGPKLFIEALQVDDIRMEIDLKDVHEPGEYKRKLNPSVPPGLVIRDFTPATIEVVVQAKRGERG